MKVPMPGYFLTSLKENTGAGGPGLAGAPLSHGFPTQAPPLALSAWCGPCGVPHGHMLSGTPPLSHSLIRSLFINVAMCSNCPNSWGRSPHGADVWLGKTDNKE